MTQSTTSARAPRQNLTARGQSWLGLVPGLLATGAVGGVSIVMASAEERVLGQQILEPLVLALILGMLIRTMFRLHHTLETGIAFAAKEVLEFAIVILGATLNLRTIVNSGVQLLLCVLIAVPLAISAAIWFGRQLGLGGKLAILVAVGNAVCGNSAIAAVAPAIRAKKQEVASAITLTAVLGIGVVFILPPVFHNAFGLSDERYGILAGMSVYAVPQVLAATLPVSAQAAAIASLVKLTRVLLLGPIVAIFAIVFRDEAGSGAKLTFSKLIPWFVIGFISMSLLRTLGIIDDELGAHAKVFSRDLTVLAMAGLGLGVNLRSVREVGPRIALVVVTSLLFLMTFTLVAMELLHIGG